MLSPSAVFVRSLATFGLFVLAGACAHQTAASPRTASHAANLQVHSAMASQAFEPSLAPPAATTRDESLGRPKGLHQEQAALAPSEPATDLALGAAVLLERALDALADNQAAFAAAALRSAVHTQDLNDAGRTLAYWYIYVAEERQGHERAKVAALADFVAIGEQVLDAKERGGETQAASDFVDRFDLEGRVARSRAQLNMLWARGHVGFGKTAATAVPVRSQAELVHFLALVPLCQAPYDRQVTQAHVVHKGPLCVEQVDTSCQHDSARARFFFEWHKQKAAQ